MAAPLRALQRAAPQGSARKACGAGACCSRMRSLRGVADAPAARLARPWTYDAGDNTTKLADNSHAGIIMPVDARGEVVAGAPVSNEQQAGELISAILLMKYARKGWPGSHARPRCVSPCGAGMARPSAASLSWPSPCRCTASCPPPGYAPRFTNCLLPPPSSGLRSARVAFYAAALYLIASGRRAGTQPARRA